MTVSQGVSSMDMCIYLNIGARGAELEQVGKVSNVQLNFSH